MRSILLTGAGFSRNWGGWLASELFEFLIGCQEVTGSPTLRALLWKHQRHNGFESALAALRVSQIFQPSSTGEADLRRMERAIASAFGHMNKHFLEQPFEWTTPPACRMTPFLARFDMLFTLNQDLLLEQHYDPHNAPAPQGGRWQGVQLPGMLPLPVPNPPPTQRLARYSYCAAQCEDFTVEPCKQPLYKLHGSVGWSDNTHETLLIMGDNKAHDLEQ